ncbi:hypothetical protein XI25_22980 [Paenibacillus sp. DMB20]|nr:hypothetical protein XI25_22980 [Paenibacillus sp. DMB20]
MLAWKLDDWNYIQQHQFCLSIAVTVSASAIALFYFRKDLLVSRTWYKLGSALIMGAGIAGMQHKGRRFLLAALSSMLTMTFRSEPLHR